MRALRFSISHATLGGALSLALVAAAPVANAQMVTPPLATVPAVQTTTTTTVHTIRTVPVHSAGRCSRARCGSRRLRICGAALRRGADACTGGRNRPGRGFRPDRRHPAVHLSLHLRTRSHPGG